jgi:hypothetical protein
MIISLVINQTRSRNSNPGVVKKYKEPQLHTRIITNLGSGKAVVNTLRDSHNEYKKDYGRSGE